MSQIIRRTFIASGAALLSACDDGLFKQFPVTRINMLKQLLSDEQFALLQDSDLRRKEVGDGPLVISERLIGGGDDHHRLDDVSLENIQFENCMFVGHKMFNVNLKNIRFNRCAFSGLRWERGRWSDLHFTECAFLERDVSILPGNGSSGVSTMERCLFRGSKPSEEKYANETRLYGTFGMGGKARYVDCEFERFDIFMDLDVELVNCRLSRADINLRFEDGARDLLIDNCTVTYDCDMPRMVLRSMTLKNSAFERVNILDAKSDRVRLENVKGSFRFTRAKFSSFDAVRCEFKEFQGAESAEEMWGLWVRMADIKSLSISDCTVSGKYARMNFHGRPPKFDENGKIVYEKGADGTQLPFFTTIGKMAWKNTPFTDSNLAYSRLGELTVEGNVMSNVALPHSEIGRLTLKNVKLSGKLDFSDTKVKEVVAENVTKDKLTIVKDKTTEVELSASVAEDIPRGLRKWLG